MRMPLVANRTLFIALMIAGISAAAPVAAQEAPTVVGRWEGALDVQGTTLRIVFEIVESDDGYSATVFSIDQGNAEVPVARTIVDGQEVILEMPAIQGEFFGTLSEDFSSIDGTWTQANNSLPLVMERVEDPGV